jgi:hypothetical protein
MRVERLCRVCTTPFMAMESELARGRGIYCSRACAGEGLRRLSAPRVKRTCRQCGAAFVCLAAQVKANRKLYCSRACAFKAQCVERTERVCGHCGETFTLRTSQVEAGRGTYCSKSCDFASRADRPNPGKTLAPPLATVAPALAIYTAGLFDGEGCVHMLGGRRCRPWVDLSQGEGNDPGGLILRALAEEWQIGKVYAISQAADRRRGMKSRDQWRFVVVPLRHVGYFLRAIAPHLRIKGAAAAEALAWLEECGY